MSLNIGELVGYISVDDSKFKSGLNKSQSDLTNFGDEGEKKAKGIGDRIGSKMGAGVALAMVFALAQVKKFAFGAVDAFSHVEDATGAAVGIFGKASPEIIAFAATAAKVYGLSQRAALETQNSIAMMGKAAGLQTTQLAGFAQKLTGLAGDMASYYGGTAEEAAAALTSALRGEMEPIRKYNVLLDDSTLRLKAMEMGLISNVKQGLTPAQKVMASYAAIVEKTTYLQGDYAKYSYYTANVQKTLAAETENAQVALGQKLAPAITAVRTVMLHLIEGFSGAIDVVIAVATEVKNLGEKVYAAREPILIVAGLVTAVFLPALIKMGVQAVISAYETVALWLMIQASAISATVKTVAQFAIQGAKWVWLGVVALNNAAKIAVSWVITQVAAVVSGDISIKQMALQGAKWVWLQVVSLANAIKVAASWVITQVAALLAGGISIKQMAIMGAKWVWMGIVALANAAKVAAAWLISLGPIGLVIAAVVGLVVIIVKNWDSIKNATTTMINGVLKGFQYMTNGIIAAINLIIRGWNLIPWHKDIKTLTNVEFPQLASAAEKAAARVDAALSKASHAHPTRGPIKGSGAKKTTPPAGFDLSGLDMSGISTVASDKAAADKKAADKKKADAAKKVISDAKKAKAKEVADLKKDKATVTKIYSDMNKEVAAFLVSKAGLVKDQGLRDAAAQSSFNDRSFDLNRSFNDDKFKLDRGYTEKKKSLNDNYSDAMATAQKNYDDAAINLAKNLVDDKFKLDRGYAEKKKSLNDNYSDSMAKAQQTYDEAAAANTQKHSDTMLQIEKTYNDKVIQLNKDAVDKRQSIIQKSIDLLTGAFSSSTSIDVGKMFSVGGGISGLLADLKAKLFGAQTLAKNAAALAAQGYTQTFIQQVVAQGPDAGNAMSDAILNATPEAASQMKDLFGQINDVSDTGVAALATSMNSGASLATRALMDEYAKVGTDLKVLLAQAYTDLTTANAAENASYSTNLASSHATLVSAQIAAAKTLSDGLADAKLSYDTSLFDMNASYLVNLAASQKTLDDAKVSAAKTLTEGLADALQSYNDSLFDMNTSLNNGLFDASKALKEALLASSNQFDTDLASLQANSLARMAALQATLKTTADLIAAISGAAAGAAVIKNSPLVTGLGTIGVPVLKVPTVPTAVTSPNLNGWNGSNAYGSQVPQAASKPTVSIEHMTVNGASESTVTGIANKLSANMQWMMAG